MTNDTGGSDRSPKGSKSEIQCVKRPFTDELKYVAISYRWGELQETTVDTGVGYLASITSFDIYDFYDLCATMNRETELQSMEYVWVDAICVNQSHHDQRKETIYHMTEIYEHATWILAVPDLHAAHLRNMTMQHHAMNTLQQYQTYLYHLVHGHINTLRRLDQAFLDSIKVPQDQKLRQLLVKYTDGFADGFTHPIEHSPHYDTGRLLDHLYNTHQSASNDTVAPIEPLTDDLAIVKNEIQYLHSCTDAHCPFQYIHYESTHSPYQHVEWHKEIVERSKLVRQAVNFMADLIIDWSSRVWVISEFHISKKKNNLKFWFTQLTPYYDESPLTFFTFDKNDPRFKTIQATQPSATAYRHGFVTSDAVYITFYQILINQLNRQLFLEMMLKSKASKNEDRFYAIFPLFPYYQRLLQTKKEELVTHSSSMLAVKLKLYQIMTSQDKMLLLYMAAEGTFTWTLPTFATPVIQWKLPDYYDRLPKHFKFEDVRLFFNQVRGLHYLRWKPSSYKVFRNVVCTDAAATRALAQLGIADVDMVQIVEPVEMWLMGSVDKNVWILGKEHVIDLNDDPSQNLPESFLGFHIH